MVNYVKNIKNKMGDYFYTFILLITMGIFELLSIAFTVNIFNYINVILILVIIFHICFLVIKKQASEIKVCSSAKAARND